MKIALVGSVELSDKIIEISDELEKMGHNTSLPFMTQKIKNGEFTLDKFKKLKKKHGGDFALRKQSNIDFFKRYFNLIKNSDVVLVLNFDKNGIKNYIGGNALMELGFAYILDKPIYLYNPVPKMSYTDEILDVRPIVINGKLTKIK